MKRLLIIILIMLISRFSYSQSPAPSGTGWTVVTVNTWKWNSVTNQFACYKGATGMWSYIVTHNELKAKLDSLSATVSHPEFVEFEITNDGQTTYDIPFSLKPTTSVWVNGNLLKSDRWSGVAGTTITLQIDAKMNDQVKISN